MTEVDIDPEDEKYKLGWSWGLMLIGGLIILSSGGVDLCYSYCIVDSGNDVDDSGNDVDDIGNDVDDSENEGIEMEEMVNDRDRAIGRIR